MDFPARLRINSLCLVLVPAYFFAPFCKAILFNQLILFHFVNSIRLSEKFCFCSPFLSVQSINVTQVAASMPCIIQVFSIPCLIRSSDPWLSVKPARNYVFKSKVVGLDHIPFYHCYRKKRHHRRLSHLEGNNISLSCRLSDFREHRVNFSTQRKALLVLATADDGVTVNGSLQATRSNDIEEVRVKLDQSLQGEDLIAGLVQSLHDVARVFELTIKEQSSKSKLSWFSTSWLGVDKTAWIKALSYQASVHSLLQAASEISSPGDGRDRDIDAFIQRSLLRQSASLERAIADELSAKQPEAFDWFWSEQVPAVVTSFINYFEKDKRSGKGISPVSDNSSDLSLLMLALSCLSAIIKLGPTKISHTQFFSNISETTGRLMDMLVEFMPICQAYCSMKEIGLHREFLVHFGPRAAACRVKNDRRSEEVVFWVNLVQRQILTAIDRERIWSRLTTSETIEVLEKDLAIFGFFIALGRSTQSFLSANGFSSVDEPVEGLIRYLIGGCVLYYPQLSSVSSYQLYAEVVCEELDWLPFYPGITGTFRLGHKKKEEGPANPEAIPIALDVCSHWIKSFIKYSKWLENASHVKAAGFLSAGRKKLRVCLEDLGKQKAASGAHSPTLQEPDSFDKALESVEEALIRLEGLLQELHVSNSNSGKEHLNAACSDLERIRKLKKEAEFLEASLRAKAASLKQGGDAGRPPYSIGENRQYSRGKEIKSNNVDKERRNISSSPRGLWSFLVRYSSRSGGPGLSIAAGNDDEYFQQSTPGSAIQDSESSEIQRFELLRSELVELEKRVQQSADQSEYEEEDIQMLDDISSHINEGEETHLVQVQKKNIIGKSVDKLKATSMDVWQGTQLLAIDLAAALGLLRRVIIGDELTQKEKQVLRRTLTDLASVAPIGFLMLLPVTAVGHAAMLAAIQRYVPSLIPSTYGPERLDLLRQLEKVKEMEDEVSLDKDAEENPK